MQANEIKKGSIVTWGSGTPRAKVIGDRPFIEDVGFGPELVCKVVLTAEMVGACGSVRFHDGFCCTVPVAGMRLVS